MNTITHEFVNFNASHLAKFTKEEFLKEFENTKVYKAFSPADRQRLLEEAWLKCKKAVDPKFEEVPVAAPTIAAEKLVDDGLSAELMPKEKKNK